METSPATKRCPFCAEEIQIAALTCRFCSRDLVSGRAPNKGGQNTMGLLAMIFGIVAYVLFVFGFPFAIAAVILGALGLGKAKRGQASGQGMALAGLWLGSIYLGLSIIIGLVAAIASSS